MRGRTTALTIVGFLIGAFAAGGIGVRVIEEVRTDEDATSVPSNAASAATAPLETDDGEILLRVPLEAAFSLSEVSPRTDVHGRVSAELVSVSPAADGTDVEVTFTCADRNDCRFSVVGVGPGWIQSQPVAADRTTAVLTWVGAELPEEFEFRVRGEQLVAVADADMSDADGGS